MSILTGKAIEAAVQVGDIHLEPFNPKQVQQVSYDFRLGDGLSVVETSYGLDAQKPCVVSSLGFDTTDFGRVLHPGNLYLGHSYEIMGSRRYRPTISAKSSLARLGVQIHLTAGMGEPGFLGQWTLEIVVTAPVRLYAGMLIGQIEFQDVSGELETYQERGRYQGRAAEGPVPSRSWEQMEEDKEGRIKALKGMGWHL